MTFIPTDNTTVVTPPPQHSSIGELSYFPPMPEEDSDAKSNKSRKFRFAVDFAYTLNHAIVCTLTDPITDVPIGATVQNLMAKQRGEGEKISGREMLAGLKPSSIAGELKDTLSLKKEPDEKFSPATSWLAGEVAGDFGAVPVVVALQHFAPSLMKGISKLAQPVAKPIFMRSAERSAKAEFTFAKQATQGPEFQTRVDEIYQREISDLPKAIMWTGVSPAINILMQKTVMGNKAPIADLALGKAIGATATSTLTVGMRAISPRHAQAWDDKMTKKVGQPVSNVVAKILRIDKEELRAGVQQKMREREHKKGWANKPPSPPEGYSR
ncbi:MAG: hypothetical protein MK052_02620 [Alphaproteobacteria bacterium]|nr:hypothetical protein [Alphaproteobacteria bacterium]